MSWIFKTLKQVIVDLFQIWRLGFLSSPDTPTGSGGDSMHFQVVVCMLLCIVYPKVYEATLY